MSPGPFVVALAHPMETKEHNQTTAMLLWILVVPIPILTRDLTCTVALTQHILLELSYYLMV